MKTIQFLLNFFSLCMLFIIIGHGTSFGEESQFPPLPYDTGLINDEQRKADVAGKCKRKYYGNNPSVYISPQGFVFGGRLQPQSPKRSSSYTGLGIGPALNIGMKIRLWPDYCTIGKIDTNKNTIEAQPDLANQIQTPIFLTIAYLPSILTMFVSGMDETVTFTTLLSFAAGISIEPPLYQIQDGTSFDYNFSLGIMGARGDIDLPNSQVRDPQLDSEAGVTKIKADVYGGYLTFGIKANY